MDHVIPSRVRCNFYWNGFWLCFLKFTVAPALSNCVKSSLEHRAIQTQLKNWKCFCWLKSAWRQKRFRSGDCVISSTDQGWRTDECTSSGGCQCVHCFVREPCHSSPKVMQGNGYGVNVRFQNFSQWVQIQNQNSVSRDLQLQQISKSIPRHSPFMPELFWSKLLRSGDLLRQWTHFGVVRERYISFFFLWLESGALCPLLQKMTLLTLLPFDTSGSRGSWGPRPPPLWRKDFFFKIMQFSGNF